MRYRVLTLVGLACLVLLSLGNSAYAAVNYADHNIFSNPSAWNGYRVYISPGHMSFDQNPYPCGSASTSEWNEAWKVAWQARNKLVDEFFYKVMMPKKDLDVSRTDRVDTGKDWDVDGIPIAYVPVHSNAHGSLPGCGHAHGGTQMLEQNAQDDGLAQRIFARLAPDSPGTTSQHENRVSNYCAISAITELCSTKALSMPTGYVEIDYHDTGQGANYVVNNTNPIGVLIARGIDCFLGKFGATCG